MSPRILLMLCGWHRVISFTARATRLPLEATAARFETYPAWNGSRPPDVTR